MDSQVHPDHTGADYRLRETHPPVPDEPTPSVKDLRQWMPPEPAAPRTQPMAPAAQQAPPPAAPVYDTGHVLSQIVPETQTRKATRGWRAALGLKASAAEVADAQAAAAMCAPFGRPVNIVVANPKGSAGKTPITLGLSGAFGLARGGGVLALEIHELRGTMHLRTEGGGNVGTVRNFLDNLEQLPPEDVRVGDVRRYVRHQITGQYDAMTSSREKGSQLTAEEFRRVQHVLARFYDVIVIDTANNERAPAWEAAMSLADALVVPVKWRSDVCVPGIQMLEDLQHDYPDLVRNAVVVASHGAGESDSACRQRMKPYFEQLASAVVELPTDPHISAGGPIITDQLTDAYRRAARTAGAAVARSITPSFTR